MKSINVSLEVFEGPFDLLFHLIEKNEIDIYDIPIFTLTSQYMEYISNMNNIDMDNISQFMVMAATLIEIKSKMLLPKPKVENEDEIDPRQELVDKLLEYKKYKNITDEFKRFESKAGHTLFKDGIDLSRTLSSHDVEIPIDDLLFDITMEDLFKAYQDVINRKEMKTDKVRSKFKSVERDLYTMEEKILYINDLLILSPVINFRNIFRDNSPKMEMVVTFLAVLEMIKMKQIRIVQDKQFGEINISKYIGSDKNEVDTVGIHN